MIWSASALRRDCAYPRVLDRGRTPPPDQQRAIDNGKKFHAAVELWQRGGKVPNAFPGTEIQQWLDKLAETWDPLEADSVKLEIAWGLGIDGSHVMVSEPRPHEYEPLSGGAPLLTAGRCDMIEEGVKGMLYVVDWKTGKWHVDPADRNLQVNAAGIALAKRWGRSHYTPGIYYAREGEWDWGYVVEIGSQAEADMFAEIRAAATLPASPLPGPWCGGCWESRKGRCPAAWKGAA